MKNLLQKAVIALSLFFAVAGSAQNHKHDTGFKMPALNPKSALAELSGNHVGIRVPDYDAAIK